MTYNESIKIDANCIFLAPVLARQLQSAKAPKKKVKTNRIV